MVLQGGRYSRGVGDGIRGEVVALEREVVALEQEGAVKEICTF